MSSLIGWKYRKKINIIGQSGAGTNYQLLLKVGESAGSSGADFNLGGLSAKFPSDKNDGGDLRFTLSDGIVLLDFWVEEVSGTAPNRVAKIWVKVLDDLGTNKSIYCYFGNISAYNYSNGDRTFLFFDDFDNGVIDSDKWADGAVKNYVLENNGIFATNTDSGISGSESANSGFFTISGTAQTNTVTEDGVLAGWLGKGIRSTPTFDLSKGLVVECGVNLSSYTIKGEGFGFGLGMGYDKDNFVNGIMAMDYAYSVHVSKEESGSRSSTTLASGLTLSTGFRRLKYIKNTSNNFSFYEDTYGGSSTSTFNSASSRISIYAYIRTVGDKIDIRYDWIFARKYAATEPVFGSAEREETLVSPRRIIFINASSSSLSFSATLSEYPLPFMALQATLETQPKHNATALQAKLETYIWRKERSTPSQNWIKEETHE